jgi:hypothetical protein
MEFINWKVEEEKKVAALVAAGYDNGYEGEAYAYGKQVKTQTTLYVYLTNFLKY